MEDKDHQGVSVGRTLQELLKHSEGTLVIQLLEKVIVAAKSNCSNSGLDLDDKEWFS